MLETADTVCTNLPGLLDPDLLSLVLISPRQRACKTYDLLFLHLSEGQRPKKVSIDESVREWDYGQCEGALASDVNAKRKAEGEKLWDIVSHCSCIADNAR